MLSYASAISISAEREAAQGRLVEQVLEILRLFRSMILQNFFCSPQTEFPALGRCCHAWQVPKPILFIRKFNG
jgi:hypothetical protein